ARRCLQNGGRVLLTIPGKEVRNYKTDPVKLGFSSIFWNTAWTGRQAPTTLGILCDPKNPALAQFPTDYYSNWQWWYLIHRAGALRLDLLPKGVKPIVRVIDDWVTAHPLALVLEGRVGAGKIVVCGFDLTHDADDPVSRQMRASLLDYMNSKKFAPEARLTADEISNLIVPPPVIKSNEVSSIKADSEQTGYEAANAIDGNPNTIWHTSWSDGAKLHPHVGRESLASARVAFYWP
ncbi:MAG TPA: beta-galactosidase, partial [Verrucomicrobiae bacterium]|nr:beta-galactosidase [Verrucomicrobiae bacterium]